MIFCLNNFPKTYPDADDDEEQVVTIPLLFLLNRRAKTIDH